MSHYQEELHDIFTKAGYLPKHGIAFAWIDRDVKMQNALKKAAHIPKEEIFEFVIVALNIKLKGHSDEEAIKGLREIALNKTMKWWDDNIGTDKTNDNTFSR